ncbi:Hsf-type dna-binding [Globisporangium polare]
MAAASGATDGSAITKRSSRRKADGGRKPNADAHETQQDDDSAETLAEADVDAAAMKKSPRPRRAAAATKQQQMDDHSTAEDEAKPPTPPLPSTATDATATFNSRIPPSIKVRIASPPTSAVHASAAVHRSDDQDDHEMDEYDAAEAADARAALRIDAATATNTTSPTSVASALSSPADDSGLNTPSGSEGVAKRRRLEDPPMFLEKTYEMLEKCAPEVACWSVPAGESFIVKKPIEFAEHVIPVYFKHKNFSSFVRQLNFYGFRKVRVDAETAASVDPKEWWEFRHDKFVRGRKDLLREIKRRTIADGRSTIERAEMDELRAEVFGLKEQLQQLNKHMMSVMQALMIRRQSPATSGASPVYDAGNNNNRHYEHPQQHHERQQEPSTPSSTHSNSSSKSAHAHHHPQLPSMAVHNGGGQQHQHHHHHQALLQLHQGLPPQVSTVSSSSSSAAGASRGSSVIPSSIGIVIPNQEQTKRSPATTYQLRPLQSVIPSVHHLSTGPTTMSTSHHVSPVLTYRSGPGSAPAGMSFVDRVDWSSYGHSQPQHHQPQEQQHQFHYASQPRFTNPFPGARGHPSGGQDRAGMLLAPPPPASSSSSTRRHADAVAAINTHAAGFKRIREESPASMHETAPDAAVRQLSMTASQTRGELLGCIIARILGFIRIQQQQPSSDEVDAVADAVVSDIQQLLARVQEPSSPVSRAQHVANSEAACMYRVEILKFISRELPRAVSDSVEKRIPPHVKKSLNRSLLALLVQKAQAALEHQMRVETSPTPPPPQHAGSAAGPSAGMSHR